MRTGKIILEGITFIIHLHSEEDKQQLLLEAKTKGTHLDGTYSAIKHQPHNSTGEYHVHVYDKGNEIFSMNKSGSPHDGYHGVTIPKKAYNALKAKYSDWKWPDNRILESYSNVAFFEIHSRSHLRPVSISKHKKEHTPAEMIDAFKGFFHGYAEVPIQSGVNWVAQTKAIIEDVDGNLNLVPITTVTFLDIEE